MLVGYKSAGVIFRSGGTSAGAYDDEGFSSDDVVAAGRAAKRLPAGKGLLAKSSSSDGEHSAQTSSWIQL
jgi:hypothetical protein